MSHKPAELNNQHGSRTINGIKMQLLMPSFKTVLECRMRRAIGVTQLHENGAITSRLSRHSISCNPLHSPATAVWETLRAFAHVHKKLGNVMLL